MFSRLSRLPSVRHCNSILYRPSVRQYHLLHPKESTKIAHLYHRKPVIGVLALRHASTIKELPAIPEPPPIPIAESKETVMEAVSQVVTTANGEATFASLGLGGYSPVGVVQNCMEILHVSADIPWWGAIAIATVCIRTMIFPLVLIAQRNAAIMHNNMPQMQAIQLKMTEARQSGNQIDAAKYGYESVQFMKEKKLNPLKNMLVPLAQAPIFISVFMGLRQMANAPVPSMATGGLFWFTDLTMTDPYYLLPLITSCTMYLTIELGTDSAQLSSQNMQTMKYVLRALPFIMLPFIINFPGAILWYWTCSNFISLAQVGVLRIPAVRDFLKIPQKVNFQPDAMPIKKKKFVEGLKDSWTNMKITNELNQRQRLDEINFQRAGKGPLQKTFKYDPTRPRPASVQAKQKQ